MGISCRPVLLLLSLTLVLFTGCAFFTGSKGPETQSNPREPEEIDDGTFEILQNQAGITGWKVVGYVSSNDDRKTNYHTELWALHTASPAYDGPNKFNKGSGKDLRMKHVGDYKEEGAFHTYLQSQPIDWDRADYRFVRHECTEVLPPK